MRCYFSSEKSGHPDAIGPGCVSFVIPELKITFRARYDGTAAACEYAGLLALLEFVEINPKVFEGRVLQVFGDCQDVIREVNDHAPCREDLSLFRKQALLMRERISCTLHWIPPSENPAGSLSPSL